jgi:hypothetical protein
MLPETLKALSEPADVAGMANNCSYTWLRQMFHHRQGKISNQEKAAKKDGRCSMYSNNRKKIKLRGGTGSAKESTGGPR